METNSSISDSGHPRGEEDYISTDYTITKLIPWADPLRRRHTATQELPKF
jgi:hypothetical protein